MCHTMEVMNVREWVFGMTFKSIFRRRTRTALTIAGIAVGIMLVTALLMIAQGLRIQFESMLEKGGGDFFVMEKNAADLMQSRVDLSVQRQLEQMDGVSWVSGIIFAGTGIKDRPYVVILGVPADESMKQFPLIEGRSLNPGDAGKMMMGRMISLQEGFTVGDTLEFKSRSFEIVGIYETGVSLQDDGGVILLTEAQSVFGFSETITMLQVKAKDIHQVDSLRAAVDSKFPQYVTLKSSEVAAAQEDLQLVTSISVLISLVAILIGSIGIMNTMVMSVMERTREIGILRAVGWKKRKVLSMVLKESLAISLCGGVIGMVLSWGVMNALIDLTKLPIMLPVTAGLVVGVFFIAVCLGILGGLYPAWRASRMSPVEALSHE